MKLKCDYCFQSLLSICVPVRPSSKGFERFTIPEVHDAGGLVSERCAAEEDRELALAGVLRGLMVGLEST